MNLNRAAFNLSRIGINLALSVAWLELLGQINLDSVTTKPVASNGLLSGMLKFGFVLFVCAEFVVSYLFLSPSTTNFMTYAVPAILLCAETLVSVFFIVSSNRVLRRLRNLSYLKDNEAIRRKSFLIFLSGCNPVLNIAILIFLTIHLDVAGNSPVVYLITVGFMNWCRLFDAFFQLLLLKPLEQAMFPASINSIIHGIARVLLSGIAPKRKVTPTPPTSNEANTKSATDGSRWQTAEGY